MVRTAGLGIPARSASWRDAIEHRAFSLLFLLGALVMAVSTTGCSLTGSGPTDTTLSGGSTTVTVGATAATSFVEAQTSTEALLRAELVLADATGADVSTMHIAAGKPGSPGATVVLEWEGGRAEVDAGSGTVYAASATRPPADASSEYMFEDRLRMESLQLVRDLGWTDGTLAGLGFKQVEPGVLAGDTGVYTIVWTQYDDKGRVQDGSIVLKLDGSSGRLVGFSAWPGRNSPDIAGVISEADALLVAQMTIYLRTDKPKLSLAGDGSLILINRAVSEELKTVKDSKIVPKPTLCWVVTILGTVDLQLVGGTVYLDAKTGEVLKYQAYKTSEPVTTTSSLE